MNRKHNCYLFIPCDLCGSIHLSVKQYNVLATVTGASPTETITTSKQH